MSCGRWHLLTLAICCQIAATFRAKQAESLVSQAMKQSSPDPGELWTRYEDFADKAEMFRKLDEQKMQRLLATQSLEWLNSMLSETEAAHGGDEHLAGFAKIVKAVTSRLEDEARRQAAKEKKGASEAEKMEQRKAQRAKWSKILSGEEKCPTGVTVNFVKADTLEEGLRVGDTLKYPLEQTVLAFDMDGTLVDMKDFNPHATMDVFSVYTETDKVVITAAESKTGSCEVVTTSMIAGVEESHMPHAVNGSKICDTYVQGAEYDPAAKTCTCRGRWPTRSFVNGLDSSCRKGLTRNNKVTAKKLRKLQENDVRCYCEPDLFKEFGIDPAEECRWVPINAKGDKMIAKKGVIMNRYGKAQGFTAYYRDPTLGGDRQYKQVIFYDDWVENPVNFADWLCFEEAPPGLEHVSAIWYATERMRRSQQEKIKKLKAGELAADNSEGNYFHPEAWNDARIAGMRAMFGEQ